jgi:hypothetical protein
MTTLYSVSGQPIPKRTDSQIRFINRFNVEADALEANNEEFRALNSLYYAQKDTAGRKFYPDLVSRSGKLKASVPESQAAWMNQANTYRSAGMLSDAVTRAKNRASDTEKAFQTGAGVQEDLSGGLWASAEDRLRALDESPNLSGAPEIVSLRNSVMSDFEKRLFDEIKGSSEHRINEFIRLHEAAIDSVPQLYADSAFLPVYQLTFSSGGQAELSRKQSEIQTYLDQIRYGSFPEASIKRIYSDFTKNTDDRGVERARAIVEHGKFYKGTDKQVQGLIIECDVNAAKWITRPKEYRKLFALPVTSNKGGTNEYMFRVQLQIPSEAQFPVFDINVKLPKEVADKAGSQRWYESITINKTPLKNEGRFRITSPTAENNYEALITPVQMDKAGKNILEVRFNYPGFRVFEVSTMAQVPIIRKD